MPHAGCSIQKKSRRNLIVAIWQWGEDDVELVEPVAADPCKLDGHYDVADDDGQISRHRSGPRRMDDLLTPLGWSGESGTKEKDGFTGFRKLRHYCVSIKSRRAKINTILMHCGCISAILSIKCEELRAARSILFLHEQALVALNAYVSSDRLGRKERKLIVEAEVVIAWAKH
jgi:hypothetical protein